MAAKNHVYKIELERANMTPEQASAAAVERLRRDGRKAEIVKMGSIPVISIDGSNYQLTLASGAGSGIGVPCAVLRERA